MTTLKMVNIVWVKISGTNRTGSGLTPPKQYFFGYKTEFFVSFQNNPKDLDPSYKMDLDLWDCLGKVKLVS